MINRNIKAIALNASLVAAILLTGLSASLAQSGAASLHGRVAFENVAYVDKQPRAKVVLQHDPPGSGPAYSTETDEHGFFEFPYTSLGRFKLEITAKGFQPYSADLYIPSDFAGNWAVRLKRKRRSAREQRNAEAGSRVCRPLRIKADVITFYSAIPSEPKRSRGISR